MENNGNTQKLKKRKLIITIVIFILAITALAAAKYESTRAYSVIVNGYHVGVVKNKSTINMLVDKINQEKSQKYEAEVKPYLNIEYKEVKGFDVKITPEKEIQKKLEDVLTYDVKAAVIKIDGKAVLWVKDTAMAEEVLEEVKASFITEDDNMQLVEAKFIEDVDINEGFVSPDRVLEKQQDAVQTLLTGTNEIKVHRVKKGECLWTIASEHRMTVSDIKKANPQMKSEVLQIGQELNLVVPKPYLNVLTKEKLKYTRGIPYETKVEYDKNLWSWQSRVKKKGVYGIKEVEAVVTKKNGVEIEREILKERVLKEPQARIVVRGTRTVPSRGTGRFIWPLKGRITSPFGWRWWRYGREFHYGVDIAAPYGTPVRAADSGTVTFRGWRGGYGRLIIIEHGNGYSTYYAHLSSYEVKLGQAVEKGEVIGRVGSSGRSTGPHTHFEIRKNGEPVNPLSFFSK